MELVHDFVAPVPDVPFQFLFKVFLFPIEKLLGLLVDPFLRDRDVVPGIRSFTTHFQFQALQVTLEKKKLEKAKEKRREMTILPLQFIYGFILVERYFIHGGMIWGWSWTVRF